MAREVIPFSQRTNLPVLTVVIGWSRAELAECRRLGITIPEVTQSAPTDALLDTGAHRSFIPAQIAARLGLTPVGERPVYQALGTAVMVPLFAARIEIITRDGLTWRTHALAPTLEVGVVPDGGGQTRVLPMPIIGRDVLNTCVFTYNGPKRCIEFDSKPKRARAK